MAKAKGESVVWGFLAVLLSVIGVLLVLLAKKKDAYAKHYAKQSLVLFIAWIIVIIIGFIPVIGWVLSPILGIIMFVLWLITLIFSLTGDMKNTPLIGKYAKKFNF